MSNEPKLPDFDQFTRWLATRSPTPKFDGGSYGTLLTAARAARDEFLSSHPGKTSIGYGPMEVLQLLAAADRSDESQPPELTTARGFRVTLSYDEGEDPKESSICVLVRCPPDVVEAVQGQTAYLWSGKQRFELGQFDAEGKAIGTLPAGIQISMSDFAVGNIKLEEPPPTAS